MTPIASSPASTKAPSNRSPARNESPSNTPGTFDWRKSANLRKTPTGGERRLKIPEAFRGPANTNSAMAETVGDDEKSNDNNSTAANEGQNPGEEKDVDTFEDAQDTSDIPNSAGPEGPDSQSHSVLKSTADVGGDAAYDGTSQPDSSLSSFRISSTLPSGLEVGNGRPTEVEASPRNTLDHIPNLPPIAQVQNPVPSPLKGLSGDLPAVNYPPPPDSVDKQPPRPLAETERKKSGPLSWFSRATTIRKPSSSPTRQSGQTTLAARRGTTSSINTLGSNADNTLNPHFDERDDGRSPTRPHVDTLKDRFQTMRLQEENVQEGEITATRNDRTGSMASPTRLEPLSPPAGRARSASTVPIPVNAKLPPGTAAGMTIGPATEDEGPVDWDLWQSVVYEGPAAVLRTSGPELSKAIANGIPQPIRGVVWQVLAQSKNEDLEAVYRELVARNPDNEDVKSPPFARKESVTHANGSAERESLASSSSSIRSVASTPATSGMATSPPPPNDHSHGEAATKLQDSLTADKTKRAAADAINVQKLEKAIKRDLGARTSYSRYLASAGLQDGLFGICKAYALYDEAVGYAQGMNFIAMPLLFNMPEEEAFTLFVRLMSKYELRSMFTVEMTGLHLRLYQFERLLEDFEPALYCHLHRRGVSPTLYATQWFLTLFAYRFPLQLVLRIYDLILSEGLSAILRFGIVLMQKNAQTLLGMKDMAQLTTFLKEKLFDVYIDKSPSASSLLESGFFGSTGGIDKEVYHADALVRDACAIEITPETLAVYTIEYEDKVRSEREREVELETLKSANVTFVTKIRGLEERAQQHDTEHVSLASDLVRTKVDNEALSDSNESLKTQVDELRKMVESQPAEVEARLQEEMQRIMTRNIEVQNQNRALEDAMQEMEQELVGTKMNYAQLNAEYEELKQKLATVQNLINAK